MAPVFGEYNVHMGMVINRLIFITAPTNKNCHCSVPSLLPSTPIACRIRPDYISKRHTTPLRSYARTLMDNKKTVVPNNCDKGHLNSRSVHFANLWIFCFQTTYLQLYPEMLNHHLNTPQNCRSLQRCPRSKHHFWGQTPSYSEFRHIQ